MKKFAVAFAAIGFLSSSTLVTAETIVSDSFESGDYSAPSAHGFKWSSGSAMTSIVSSTTELFSTSSVNKPAPENSQWEAKSGDNALRLHYSAGKHWTEQKFYLSEPQPDIWMSFWLRVPVNFRHPEKGDAGDNQKLFYLWMDGYSYKGEGSSVGMEFRGNGRGGSYFYGKISPGGFNGAAGDRGKAPFIEIPSDRGKWMHLVVHIASENSAGASDGVMEVWRKWEGESDYMKTQDLQNQPIRLSSSVKGFSAGYLLGYANAVYPVVTEFMLDDFELATTPLFLSSEYPNSPSNFIIR